MSGEESKIRLDARSLRGIAHPLRVRILGMLREHGPSTATRLAERLGQSTGATSYHLRQLATYGFVAEEEDRGIGRERWWRAVHRSTVLDDREVADQVPAEVEAYLRGVASVYAERMDRWLGELVSLPREWAGAATLSDWLLRLTPAETTALHDELVAVIQRYRREPAEPGDVPAGASRIAVQVQLMPFIGDQPGGGAQPDDAVQP